MSDPGCTSSEINLILLCRNPAEHRQGRLPRGAVSEADKALKAAGEVRREAGETSAVAREKSAAAESALLQSIESRDRTVTRFQEFAATGLLDAALPQFDMPDVKIAWTIDPALSVARRAEQALLEVRDDDATWAHQVAAINTELQKHPASTGVRFRLQWQPLADTDGAPTGLEAARKRLLNTSADLWSGEDRSVVGAMFQQ